MKTCRTLTIFLALAAFTMKAFAEEPRPVVSGIQAMPTGTNKITVSWNLPSSSRGQRIIRQNIYKSTRPFTTKDDLNEELLAATLDYTYSSYTDTVTDYREYYYAVITLTGEGDFGEDELFYDEETDSLPEEVLADAKPYLIVLPGVNATVKGCRVQLPVRASQVVQDAPQTAEVQNLQGDKRSLPLAYIELESRTEGTKKTISYETESIARTLAKKDSPVKPFTEPYVFEEDLMMPAKGTDDYALFDILKTSFIRQDYKKACKDLSAFLIADRSPETLRRARFYLGQSYYFLQDYASAVTNFLCTEEDMSPLVRKWTENALDLYEIPQAY